MIQINLLPVREARRKADAQQQLLITLGTIAATIVAAFMFHQVYKLDINDSRRRVREAQERLEQFKPQQAQVEEYKKKKSEIERKLEVIARLKRSRSGPVRILDELAKYTPERVWLTKLETSGGSIEVEGMSGDNHLVAEFLTALSASPYFGGVELVETKLQVVDELRLNTFIIQAQIQDPGALEDAAKKNAPYVPAAAQG